MTSSTSTPTSSAAEAKPAKTNTQPPRGKAVSGRVWKTVQTKRFSSMRLTGTKVLSTTWEEKQLQKAKLKQMKELQAEIKARKQGERDAKRQAREEKEKRRKENELKSASVQVVRCWLWTHALLDFVVGSTDLFMIPWHTLLADLPHAPHQGHEQEAVAQREEDDREQARSGGVRASVLQVSSRRLRTPRDMGKTIKPTPSRVRRSVDRVVLLHCFEPPSLSRLRMHIVSNQHYRSPCLHPFFKHAYALRLLVSALFACASCARHSSMASSAVDSFG